MAVPTHDSPYTPQAIALDAAVSFDITQDWSNADTWEINTLPPGFTFDGTDLGGTGDTEQFYTIFVRAGNADGFSDWQPLQFDVNAGVPATDRLLRGLSLAWVQILTATAAVITIKKAGPSGRQSSWNMGMLLVSDIGNDGNAAEYRPNFLDENFSVSVAANTFVRATEPGWEIVVDTS